MATFLKRYIKIRKERVANELQLRFLERLHRLLSNGYPLVSALEILTWDKQMTQPAAKITAGLKNGNTIDQAFEEASFHPSITSYLFFIRLNGDLQESIGKCADMFAHRMKYMKKFQQIIRYPLILLFIFSVLLYFIKQYVLPAFSELFQNTSASATLSITMKILDFMGTAALISLAVILTALLIWKTRKKKLPVEIQIQLFNSIPIYRSFLKLQTSFLFAMHFNTLLKTGMSFKEILHQMANQHKIPIIAYYSGLMTAELTKGLHITYLLSQFTFLEKQLASIFQKNADIRSLEKDLTVYAELLTEEIQRKIVKTITYIQPVFFIILAGFIIFIYITLMWPMFDLIKTI